MNASLLPAMRDFTLICGLGLLVAGLTAYLMTWAIVAVHLRDKHPDERAHLGGFLFTPRAFGWYLRARYRALNDATLNTLGILGTIGAWAIVIGAIVALTSQVLGLSGVAGI
ncbi:MAG: hypothetical protein ABI082_10580 [Dokdonella sp.]